tara:strand:- start:104 stop:283 length:180 start_codon:yes stop_codon:yes gene_type:complete
MKASRPRAGGPVAIERSIKKHIALTAKYVAEGLTYEAASKKAYNEIVSKAEGKCLLSLC